MTLSTLQEVFATGFALHLAFPIIEGIRVRRFTQVQDRIKDRHSGILKSVTYFHEELDRVRPTDPQIVDVADDRLRSCRRAADGGFGHLRHRLDFTFCDLERAVYRLTLVSAGVASYSAIAIVLPIFSVDWSIHWSVAGILAAFALLPFVFLCVVAERRTSKATSELIDTIETEFGDRLIELDRLKDEVMRVSPEFEFRFFLKGT